MTKPLANNPSADRQAALDSSLQVFLEEAKAYPRELARTKPSPTAFSATEIVFHILDVERLWQRRMHGLLDRSMTHFAQMDPEKEARDNSYNDKDIDEGIALFIATRQETHRLVSGMTDEQLLLTGIHSKYGEMNILQILEIMTNHDLNHTAQLKRTLAAITSPNTAAPTAS